MITNNHVLDDNYYNKKEIKIEVNKAYKDIKSDSKRKKYSDKAYDITIIEITPKDKTKLFLEIDEKIYLLDSNKSFQKTSTYIFQYPNIYYSSVSFGLVRNLDIDNNLLSNFYQIYNGSSGASIIDSNKVIGIYRRSKRQI